MNIILILVSIILLANSICLFYVVKIKRNKIEFTHIVSDNTWDVFKTNFWTIIRSYLQEHTYNVLISSAIVTGFISTIIYFLQKGSILQIILIILLGCYWGAVGGYLTAGSNRLNEEVAYGTENFFKLIKKTVEDIKELFTKNKIENVVFSGYIELPSKVYVNESATILINLFSNLSLSESVREYLELSEQEKLKLIDVHLQRKENSLQILKVDLQAASLKISGETSQQVDLVNDNIKFQWSISSEKPTFHKIVLIFSKVSGSSVKHLGEIEHTIKFINLFGLTRRQVLIGAIISGISGTLGLISTFEKLFETLGYINKH